VLAVAGVDDHGGARLANDMRGAGVLIANNDAVDLISIERHNGIDEALALDGRRGGAAEVKSVGGKALLGKLKGATGARRRLVEHVDDSLTLKGGDLLDRALVDLGERLGGL